MYELYAIVDSITRSIAIYNYNITTYFIVLLGQGERERGEGVSFWKRETRCYAFCNIYIYVYLQGVTLRRWQQPVRRKDSVARITLSGLHYIVEVSQPFIHLLSILSIVIVLESTL